MGLNCSVPICYSLSAEEPLVCSGKGKCLTPNQCSCNDNDEKGHYNGTACEKCKAPYSGQNCNIIETCTAVEKCNSHGSCDEFGYCSCFQDGLKGNWNGSNCQICTNGYYGEDCLTQFLSSIKFNNQGNALVLKIRYPPQFESVNVDCINLLGSEKRSSFGSNPTCHYSNRTSYDFIIELDQDHSINVGDEISLNRNVFNTISKVKDFTSFKVEMANQPSSPFVFISYKNTYSSCENVVLDASESYSLDRKEISFKWEIVNSNLVSIQQGDASKLVINYQDLNTGSHTFKLTVTDSLFKTSTSKQITFQKLAYSTPIISIDGSEKITIKTNELPIVVRKKVVLPECLPSNSEIVVNWEYSSGVGCQYQVDSYNNLKISKFNDLSQTSHQFTVSTYLKGNEQQKSTATVNIELSPNPLTVNLLLVESTVNYVTFEVEETDLDEENIPFVRSWTFSSLANPSVILNYLQSTTTTTMTIKKEMTGVSSQFDITLQSSKGARNAKSTISLNFPDSPVKIPPIITLANTVPTSVNKGDSVNIQLLVSVEGNVIRNWTLNSKSIPSSMTNTMLASLSESSNIILNTDSLEEESLNQIKYTVTSLVSGLSATFEHQFRINKTPKSCNCQIVPSSGIAMTTSFTFNCQNCQNEEKSYNFEYGFIDDYSRSKITLSKDEELYQKLPAPYQGSELELYVTVIDSNTGATITSTRKVTISLPSVKSLAEIQKLAKSWNQVASMLPVGDYRRSVFNAATVSRTATMMIKLLALSGRKRSNCNGNGQLGTDGKCICNQGYVSSDCKWTSAQFETIQSLISDLLNDFVNLNQVKLQSGESISRDYLTNFDYFEGMYSVQSSSLTLESGEVTYLKGILNYLYKVVSQSQEEKNAGLVNSSSSKLGNLLLRSVIIGQSPIRFETSYHLNLLNKHFKKDLNSMILQSEYVNITLPSTISNSISTKSIKTPVMYDWYILNDYASSFVLPQKSNYKASLVSFVNQLTFNPSPSIIEETKSFNYFIRINHYTSDATYSCTHMSMDESHDANCTIKIENQIANCKCSKLYNIGIVEYLPIVVTPPTNNTKNTSSNFISDLFWILWGFLIAICISICIVSILVFVICKKRKNASKKSPHSFMQTQESALTLEMKQV